MHVLRQKKLMHVNSKYATKTAIVAWRSFACVVTAVKMKAIPYTSNLITELYNLHYIFRINNTTYTISDVSAFHQVLAWGQR